MDNDDNKMLSNYYQHAYLTHVGVKFVKFPTHTRKLYTCKFNAKRRITFQIVTDDRSRIFAATRKKYMVTADRIPDRR